MTKQKLNLRGKSLRRYNSDYSDLEPVKVIEENGSLLYVENEKTGERYWCGREEAF